MRETDWTKEGEVFPLFLIWIQPWFCITLFFLPWLSIVNCILISAYISSTSSLFSSFLSLHFLYICTFIPHYHLTSMRSSLIHPSLSPSINIFLFLHSCSLSNHILVVTTPFSFLINYALDENAVHFRIERTILELNLCQNISAIF